MNRTATEFLRRRTGLIIPLLLLIIGVVLGVGTVTMDVPANTASPGPRLFPVIIAIACVVFAVLLTVDVLRNPEPAKVSAPTRDGEVPPVAHAVHADEDAEEPAAEEEPTRVRSNHRALAGAVATVVVFIAVLNPLGWLLSGALLFWGISRALGSRRVVFDVFLSLAISSIVQLAFSAGLGLNLPPGILAGVL
ncbi:putative tricarboxylic transport membrane protein [Actinoalloteichus hoggarensis]|uniref:Tripartite tricarboxylate transporter TctB family protein n=1 Tax=Actinoalloteichus hoggarensis TaxID=1470176 RepID=A0A221VYW5_9PSEU|nr:tripartite tricarboxylate transporter TctB family protein [Actinoalloteichus hoggarensis]ASO18707.1 Tripartite tricarboxylate transporter TctB family protein [Actinoalloteichus hoggarensis]MBB5919940.1 putative tricarboxylic transport membrane protein [Actinoalloteichus hoggarensis]